MKPYTYSLLAAAFACGLAQGAATAYTTPVGYVTASPLQPNQFNLISLTLNQPTIAAGILDAETSSSVTDNEVNFGTLLTVGQTYVLELENGVIQEVTSWSGSQLTTQNITSSVVPGTTTYILRKASTISDVFGPTNSTPGLTPSDDGDLTDDIADTIQVYNGSGFDVIYYFNNGLAGEENVQGWFTETGSPAADYPIVYADGFYVRRFAGSPKTLTVTGEVKTAPTSGVLGAGFNYLGAVAPVGLTLDNCGLEDFLSQSPDGDAELVDQVQIQVTGGAYRNCYYFNNGLTGEENVQGWFDDTGAPAGDQVLETGFHILNRGGTKPYSLSVPTSYAGL